MTTNTTTTTTTRREEIEATARDLIRTIRRPTDPGWAAAQAERVAVRLVDAQRPPECEALTVAELRRVLEQLRRLETTGLLRPGQVDMPEVQALIVRIQEMLPTQRAASETPTRPRVIRTRYDRLSGRSIPA